ncbi:MAG: hypothetical protein NTY02_17590 [Acidobacteria bacterium]|nr:hypothetical protein [Acidobacteriota bacterium]
MEIFLVPVGHDGYELYCEVDDHVASSTDARGPWRRRASAAFHGTLAYIEAERRRRLESAGGAVPRTRGQRLRDRVLAWLAERVAEQRLLWHLRSQTEVTARFPDDIGAADAAAVVQGSLRRDSRRHLVWMLVHTFAYLASLPLTPLPGPNVLAVFFSFRALGHALSWLGARQGLRRVRWRHEPSDALADLRRLASLHGSPRTQLAHDVAARLHLRHLDTFVERMTLGGP